MKNYIEISKPETFAEYNDFSEIVQAAFDFCKKYNVRIFAQEIPERPDGIGNDWGGNKYRVIIRRNNRRFTLYFTDSKKNQECGLIPTCYDILACIEKSFYGDMSDFISEFGYTINSAEEFRRIERAYKAIKREVAGVRRLFGAWENACFDELCEIC